MFVLLKESDILTITKLKTFISELINVNEIVFKLTTDFRNFKFYYRVTSIKSLRIQLCTYNESSVRNSATNIKIKNHLLNFIN